MMTMKYWTVDVFSEKPFSGNSAGVFLNEKKLTDELYQRLALELFQPETAFITPIENLTGHYSIRFFTPHTEKKVCGCSILAAAHILWDENNYPKDQSLYFEAYDGIRKVVRQDNVMSLTLPRSVIVQTASPDRLFKAIGTLPVSVFECDEDLIVELHSLEELLSLEVDFAKLSTIEYNRIIVTCEDDTQQFDYVCRVFSPRLDIDEESATLQSHCDLASFWANQTGRTSFKAKQVGLRTGQIDVSLTDESITISGTAVIVASGSFRNIE